MNHPLPRPDALRPAPGSSGTGRPPASEGRKRTRVRCRHGGCSRFGGTQTLIAPQTSRHRRSTAGGMLASLAPRVSRRETPIALIVPPIPHGHHAQHGPCPPPTPGQDVQRPQEATSAAPQAVAGRAVVAEHSGTAPKHGRDHASHTLRHGRAGCAGQGEKHSPARTSPRGSCGDHL
jgi:hypothetical protein